MQGTGKHENDAMRTLKGAGIFLAGIVGAVTLVFLFALYIKRLLWVSKNVLDYLNIAAIIAFAACVFVLLPLALFRSKASPFICLWIVLRHTLALAGDTC